MITALDPVVPPPDDDAPTGLSADHPMRLVTRTVAFDPDGWTAATRRQVTELFDSLADEWNSRDVPGREAPLVDALDRGLAGAPAPAGGRTTCIDIGAGTGLYSRILGPRFPTLVSVDLALEMLRNAPAAPAARVQADASCLPVPDGSVDVLVLANAFLFPAEVERVLAPHGAVVWVNSRGTDTPIHLLAEEVDSALPGEWSGVSSTAGWGTWSTHWRAA
jgi:predicted TPR repeat methyltransferase